MSLSLRSLSLRLPEVVPSITRAFVSGCVSGVVLLLAFLLLSTCSPLVALAGGTDEYGYNERGQYEAWSSSPQRDAWSPASPNSNRYTEQDRDAYRDWRNTETTRRNEALTDLYYHSSPSPRSDTFRPAWEDSYTVQTPRGSAVCQKGPNGYVFCQ